MFRKHLNYILLAGFGLALAGCGHSPSDRAMSGGLIGAGTGPVGGALAGGAVGAVGGAATSPDTINLGRPIWR